MIQSSGITPDLKAVKQTNVRMKGKRRKRCKLLVYLKESQWIRAKELFNLRVMREDLTSP